MNRQCTATNLRAAWLLLVSAPAMVGISSPALAGGATLTTIYSFAGSPSDGSGPVGGLVTDASGALYGTTTYGGIVACQYNKGCGTVFKLTPPAAGQTQWTETILYAFTGGADGANPMAGLAIDRKGILYGTTFGDQDGGKPGNVFTLTPPAAGESAWTETVIAQFTVGPRAPVLIDKQRNLYGTTYEGGVNANDGSGYGTVFRLQPPVNGHSGWTNTVLYEFLNNTADGGYPEAGLAMDSNGALYGTNTSGGGNPGDCGTVFQLTPGAETADPWVETILASFPSQSGYTYCLTTGLPHLDANGVLYINASGDNTVEFGGIFALTPPPAGQTAWTLTNIYSFPAPRGHGDDPKAGVIEDSFGKLYGTTAGISTPRNPGASLFELVPPAAGQTAWTEKKLITFNGTNGSLPKSELLLAKNGKLYGTTSTGGANGQGTVFEVTR